MSVGVCLHKAYEASDVNITVGYVWITILVNILLLNLYELIYKCMNEYLFIQI